ncbi:Fur-regulated basic protein FbpA [Bacillus sinesaloumensis]|uniref:Fur-regulated basic protein FbpA n=1 Tax=Litchfieldia sinesaloumensis TaxID=1926280 RepID=UPI0009885823|nr:Fur-regulated basic protein FbpA [Bacillus sinesaloumensis]
MGELLRHAVQFKKKEIINILIKQGIYKKDNKHLYELTLSELENEYKVYLNTSQKDDHVLKIN